MLWKIMPVLLLSLMYGIAPAFSAPTKPPTPGLNVKTMMTAGGTPGAAGVGMNRLTLSPMLPETPAGKPDLNDVKARFQAPPDPHTPQGTSQSTGTTMRPGDLGVDDFSDDMRGLGLKDPAPKTTSASSITQAGGAKTKSDTGNIGQVAPETKPVKDITRTQTNSLEPPVMELNPKLPTLPPGSTTKPGSIGRGTTA
ncbi:hypothetical protein EX30DRAFT_372829 [Ascodesmis nigricans]|uniref:Uncharacterized protein n=1 Tax=Ascodesmis nigricans TaxID=341454 RepID=A0A4S2MTI9_9PEZI|nr:hypothetical protein EX30DRAFT_372829 [Ascodesmis nigricans]